jgi:hypothetical protein
LRVGSPALDVMRSGRSPASSDCSATREDLLAERTEAKVAPASTNVPPPVVIAEIITQLAMAHSMLLFFFTGKLRSVA